jgi:putative phage-type endonuclease
MNTDVPSKTLEDGYTVSIRTFDKFGGSIVSDIPTNKAFQEATDSPTTDDINDEFSHMHRDVARMLRRPRITQHTDAWIEKRKKMITATNVASILKKSPWQSYDQLFKRKTGQKKPTARNIAMSHGLFYEPEALRVFTLVTGIELYQGDIGLMVHREFDWVGASPDAVAKYFPWLIEIKCPSSAKIKHKCPPYYYTQIQLQLEVCDLERCYLVQYLPPNMPLSRGHIDILCVERDPSWWTDTFPEMNKFWKKVVDFYKEVGHPVGEQSIDWEEYKRKERERQRAKNTRCSIVSTGTSKFVQGRPPRKKRKIEANKTDDS